MFVTDLRRAIQPAALANEFRHLGATVRGSTPFAGASPAGAAPGSAAALEEKRAALFAQVERLDDRLQDAVRRFRNYQLIRLALLTFLAVALVVVVVLFLFNQQYVGGGLGATALIGLVVWQFNALQQLFEEQMRWRMRLERYRPRIAVAPDEETLGRITDEIEADLRFLDEPRLKLPEFARSHGVTA